MKIYVLVSLTAMRSAMALLVAFPGMALAQDAGSLLRQQELREQRQIHETAPAPAQNSPTTKPRTLNVVTVRLQSVRFEGATGLLPQAQLQEAVADAIGKDHDLAGLQSLADRITQLLKRQGFFLGRAYLPRQDVTSGELEIRLVAGVLSTNEPVRILEADQGKLRIDTQHLKSIADTSLQGGKVAREEDMERPVMLMGDLPGITAKARMEPGVEPESTQVLIDVEEGPLLSGNLSLDNFGSRSTGDGQINGLLNFNDPMHIGDQLSLGFVHAEGFETGRLSYSLPLGAHGTRLAASASLLDYHHVDGLGLAAGLRGNASTTGLTLSHPLVRSRASNLNIEGGATRKVTQDNSTVGNLHAKFSDGAFIGLHADHYDDVGGGGLSLWNLSFNTGQLDLSSNATDAADDAKTYRTQGSFSKLNWGAARLQKLDGTFTLYANLAGQTAFSNLGSAEQFILGGPYGVRAYSGGEAAGDSGWLLNLELRYDLSAGEKWGKWQLMGFYDLGQITLHKDSRGLAVPTALGANEYQISGWGLGVQLNNNGSHTLRLVWAQKIGSNPGSSVSGLDADGRSDSSRLWFTGTVYF